MPKVETPKIRFGIIGYGKMGKIRRKTISRRRDTEVAIIVEPTLDKDYTRAGCRYTRDVDELFADSSLDAVMICAPNYLLKPLVIRSLKQGLHVFCEKPPGMSLSEIKAIRRIEKKHPKLMLKFGFNHRYHAAVIELKKQIDSGKFGKVIWMRGRYGKSVNEDFFTEWRAKKELAGGGILLDQGIHMLDLFLYICNDFEEVKSFCSNKYWQADIEDNAFIILRNKEGQQASMHSTMTQWRHLFSFEVFLERGYMVINGFNTSTQSYGTESLTIAVNRSEVPRATHTMEKEKIYKGDRSWNLELKEFVEAIQNKGSIQNGNSDDALKIMKLIDKIYADGFK